MTSRRVLTVGVAFVLLVGAAVAAILVLPPRQSADVAMPAADAVPEQVVTAFVAALNAHDCTVAEALSTPEARDQTASWCRDVGALDDLGVAPHVLEPPEDSGRAADELVANVGVTFDLDWRPLRSDVSMPEGETTWGYLLVRSPRERAWRVFEQGVG
ncbi:hypothetical protein [Phycicoccus avicenniae]|uniref:hypothetical protein n=1 Tax=Phycicoccus avicenniae TaxID=2828860 RepID=UPI003D2C04D5